MTQSATDLRAEFLALRAKGITPRAPIALSELTSEGAPTRARARVPARYLEGQTDTERRVSLLRELAKLDGWSVVEVEKSAADCWGNSDPREVRHSDGRAVFCGYGAKAGKADLSAQAPETTDRWGWHNDLEKSMGGSRSISVSLKRPVDALLGDIGRRLLEPYARAWPDVQDKAREHEAGLWEAETVAQYFADRYGSRGGYGNHPKVWLDGGSLEIQASYTASEPKAIFEHLSVSVEHAESICKIITNREQ